MDDLRIPEEYRQKTLKLNNKLFKVDAFDPITNTVYEFNGDYWHGNPQVFDANKLHPDRKISFGELYLRTLQRESILKSAGYNVVSVWERDYKSSIISDDKIRF